MSRMNKKHPQARSWRDITQQVKPRAMSRGGRWRKFKTICRVSVVVLTIGLIAGGTYVFTDLFQNNPRKISTVVNAVPVEEIILRTDGVLDHKWLTQTLALPARATLLELDMSLLRDRLLTDNQVRSASITRKFPSTLEVSISERSPVALVYARVGNATPRLLQVARDGVVYSGRGYDQALLSSLLYLDGVKLAKSGASLRPIAGMDVVSDLLATARNEAPHLYKSWKVVSLARLDSEGELEVRATNIDRIIFMAHKSTDFLLQIAQLDALIDSLMTQADQPVSEINLAIGRMTDGRIQVPVTFKEFHPEPLIVPGKPPVTTSTSYFKPTRPSNREL